MIITRYPCRASLLAGLGVLLAAPATRAQAPGWQAAVGIATSSPSTSAISLSATDASGNVLVAGDFQGTITLGSTTLSTVGTRVPFVAKWNTATGTWAWAQQLTSTAGAFAGGLAVVGSSIYLSGSFKGTFTAGSLTLSSPNNFDTFVAKLTDAGASSTWSWARQAGGSGDDFGYGVAAQGSSVYTVGLSYSPTLGLGTLSVPNPGANTTFVAKLTDSGPSTAYTWALAPSGAGFSVLRTLAVQGNAVYAAGQVQGTQAFGSTTLATSTLNDSDALITKITDAGPTGAWTWAQRAGGTGGDQAVRLAVSGAAVYAVGSFSSATASFGTTTLASAGGSDIFVAKLADAGATSTWGWAQRAGGPADDLGEGLAVRGASVYISGDVASSPAAFGSTALVPAGNSAAFVARLAEAGGGATFAWAQAVASPSFGVAPALTLAGNQLYVGGITTGNTTFGTQTLAGSISTPYGYLASIADAALLPATAPQTATTGLGVFPNPARGTATVQLPAGLGAGPTTLTLLDALGRVVRTRTMALPAGTTTTDLDVAGLAPGVYALRVATGERLGTARLVVE